LQQRRKAAIHEGEKLHTLFFLLIENNTGNTKINNNKDEVRGEEKRNTFQQIPNKNPKNVILQCMGVCE